MKKRFKILITDSIVRSVMLVTGFVIIGELILTTLFFKSLPPFIPLFNQQPWGQSQLGRNVDIFIPIFFVISTFIVNTFLASFLYDKMPLTSRLLCITSLFVAFFAFLLIIRTIFVIV